MSHNELSKIVRQMEDVSKKIDEIHNKIKGARLMRDACIKELPCTKNHFYEVFEVAVYDLEKAFSEQCKIHEHLYKMTLPTEASA